MIQAVVLLFVASCFLENVLAASFYQTCFEETNAKRQTENMPPLQANAVIQMETQEYANRIASGMVEIPRHVATKPPLYYVPAPGEESQMNMANSGLNSNAGYNPNGAYNQNAAYNHNGAYNPNGANNPNEAYNLNGAYNPNEAVYPNAANPMSAKKQQTENYVEKQNKHHKRGYSRSRRSVSAYAKESPKKFSGGDWALRGVPKNFDKIFFHSPEQIMNTLYNSRRMGCAIAKNLNGGAIVVINYQ